ncbi:MAG: hypothetical protein ACREBG_02660 [Pyrinomonadaceae bacterium]
MKVFWLIVAGACAFVAAVFLWRGDFDTAFVVAVIGMVAWFLNYRMQVKANLAARNAEREETDEAKDLDEDE